MTSLRQQIIEQKKQKSENLKDIFFVDYCYHCKDPEIRTKEAVSCHHPWYCHHDNGPVQELEAKIGKIEHNSWLRGFMCSYEFEELKLLRDRKWDLIKECRRSMPRVKVSK